MTRYKIAVIPGDGIGREVIPAAVEVLKATQSIVSNLDFEFINIHGGAEYWLETGRKEEWPAGSYEACKEADAVLLGAVGLPDAVYPNGRIVGGDIIWSLRFGLDLYANVRPVKLYEEVPCPLVEKTYRDIDFIVIRENTEGLYSPIRGTLSRGGETEMAADVRVVTRKGAERIIKFAFELCRKRSKGAPLDKKLRVTCIDKSNVLEGCVLFRKIYYEVAKNYPEIETDVAYIDAWTQWVLRRPEWYDVCVTTNLFGDIITDLAAVLQGGLGVAPSAEIGDKHGMFRPVHGSTPKYYGKKVANPIAAILSAKMMLEWLGERCNDNSAKESATRIENAVQKILKHGKTLTPDLGGNSRTDEVAYAIAKAIESGE